VNIEYLSKNLTAYENNPKMSEYSQLCIIFLLFNKSLAELPVQVVLKTAHIVLEVFV
jgi:hypothetical protein